jgi:hypothetical protein
MELSEILKNMTPEHAAVVQATIDQLNANVTKAKADLDTATAELETAKGNCKKAEDDAKTANEACTTMKAELEASKAGSTPFDETETFKAMPEAAKAYILKMKTQKEAAEAQVVKARDAEIEATAVAKAAELKALPIEQTKLVGILKGASPELLEILTTVNAAIDGTVLNEMGKSKGGMATATSEEAWAKIDLKAQEIAKAEGISKAKAIGKAVDQNPDLYRQYLQGGAN